jgi:hypothetical protein
MYTCMHFCITVYTVECTYAHVNASTNKIFYIYVLLCVYLMSMIVCHQTYLLPLLENKCNSTSTLYPMFAIEDNVVDIPYSVVND